MLSAFSLPRGKLYFIKQRVSFKGEPTRDKEKIYGERYKLRNSANILCGFMKRTTKSRPRIQSSAVFHDPELLMCVKLQFHKCKLVQALLL